MIRVTYKDEMGYHLKTECEEADTVSILGRYEDSGLEPCDYATMRHALERLEEMKNDWSELLHLIGGVGVDRIKGLVNADKEGRLVVLPCKVGDTVWEIKQSYVDWPDVSSHFVHKSIFSIHDLPKFGKTIFLTREEAEKTLGRDNNVLATDINVGRTKGGDI